MVDNNPYEIKVSKYSWKQKMLITGHYEFEILLKYSENLNEISGDKIIYRRYSDFEWLHNELLQNNPGCKILDIPEKNVWCNIKVNNNDLLENRKKQIENYLNYINNHEFLRKNKSFKDFISNNFNSEANTKKSFYDNIVNLTNHLPNIFKSHKTLGVNNIEDDSDLDKERENLVRLYNSTEKISNTMSEFFKIQEEKIESIKCLKDTTNNIKYLYLNYDKYSKMFDYDDNFSDSPEKNLNRLSFSKEDIQDVELKKNLEFTKMYYDKNRILLNKFTQDFQEQINDYKYDLTKLIEIFDRRVVEEQKLKNLENENADDIIKNSMKEKLTNLKEELKHEINLFKINKENQLIDIIKKFFKCLYQNNEEIINKI